ncbi:MAG: hypothetical protein AB7U49_10520 [Hyphomicrobiaceae bacterium]
MKPSIAASLSLAVLSSVAIATPLAEALAASGPYSAAVRRACRGDYNRFCPGYSLYSTELRRCMQSAGKAVSKNCVRALVNAGEAPRSYLKYYK